MTVEEFATPEEYLVIAEKYIIIKKYAEAEKYLLKSQELFPNDSETLNYLHFIERQKSIKDKNYDEEIRLGYKLLEERDEMLTGEAHMDISPYLSLGDTLRISKRYQEAIQMSNKALSYVEEVDPNNFNLKTILYYRLSFENLEAGYHDEALKNIDQALKIYPENDYFMELKKNILELRNENS